MNNPKPPKASIASLIDRTNKAGEDYDRTEETMDQDKNDPTFSEDGASDNATSGEDELRDLAQRLQPSLDRPISEDKTASSDLQLSDDEEDDASLISSSDFNEDGLLKEQDDPASASAADQGESRELLIGETPSSAAQEGEQTLEPFPQLRFSHSQPFRSNNDNSSAATADDLPQANPQSHEYGQNPSPSQSPASSNSAQEWPEWVTPSQKESHPQNPQQAPLDSSAQGAAQDPTMGPTMGAAMSNAPFYPNQQQPHPAQPAQPAQHNVQQNIPGGAPYHNPPHPGHAPQAAPAQPYEAAGLQSNQWPVQTASEQSNLPQAQTNLNFPSPKQGRLVGSIIGGGISAALLYFILNSTFPSDKAQNSPAGPAPASTEQKLASNGVPNANKTVIGQGAQETAVIENTPVDNAVQENAARSAAAAAKLQEQTENTPAPSSTADQPAQPAPERQASLQNEPARAETSEPAAAPQANTQGPVSTPPAQTAPAPGEQAALPPAQTAPVETGTAPNSAPPAAAPQKLSSAPANAPVQPAPESEPVVKSFNSLSQAQQTEYNELVAQADTLVQAGDISAARLLYEHAASVGHILASLKLAQTYDPVYMEQMHITSVQPDPKLAQRWYKAAAQHGNQQASANLKSLNSWLKNVDRFNNN